MVRIDDLLAPFEKQLARYSLVNSLAVVHAYIQYLQFGQALPNAIEIDPVVAAKKGYDRNYYEWELDLLSRELLRYAPMVGPFSLTRWNEFASTLNMLKELDDAISVRAGDLLKDNILLELGRIAYREFPWQERPNHMRLTRFYKIFGDPAVDSIINAEIGLSAKELYLLGLAFIGHFLTNFAYLYPVDATMIGISDNKCRIFMQRFSKPLSELSKMAIKSEFRNENFHYSQNPLRVFPIVHVGLAGKHHLIAPIPTYLFHRFTAGIYYELIANPGFGNALGASFQRYIGDVLKTVLPADRFTICAEQEYHVGKNRKDSIDWIATDSTAHLFIECKTKRMQLNSRIALADPTSLNADVAKIADFICQAYKTIEDAKSYRYAQWRPDERPVYPILVLLEEWYLFDVRLEEALERQIAKKLVATGIDPSVMKTSPYSICSCGDFELLAQVIATTGTAEILRKKHVGERTKWNMRSFLLSDFGEQVSKIKKGGLFRDVLDSIQPVIGRSTSHHGQIDQGGSL